MSLRVRMVVLSIWLIAAASVVTVVGKSVGLYSVGLYSVGDVTDDGSSVSGEDCNGGGGIFGNPYTSGISGFGISYPWALNGWFSLELLTCSYSLCVGG